MPNQRGFAPVIIIIIIAVVAIFSYLYLSGKLNTIATKSSPKTVGSEASPSSDYVNPFDDKASYTNPFESSSSSPSKDNYKNPFDF